jgi:anthranilate synthase component I
LRADLIHFNGNLDTCITIGTALIKDGKAYIQAGGGWVNDSTPDGEFQETVNKSMAMRKAIAMAEGFVNKQSVATKRCSWCSGLQLRSN